MKNKNIKKVRCYRCGGTKEALDYAKSKQLGRDVYMGCMMCNGKGYIYEDEDGKQIYNYEASCKLPAQAGTDKDLKC